jgi:hypothetical protein
MWLNTIIKKQMQQVKINLSASIGGTNSYTARDYRVSILRYYIGEGLCISWLMICTIIHILQL